MCNSSVEGLEYSWLIDVQYAITRLKFEKITKKEADSHLSLPLLISICFLLFLVFFQIVRLAVFKWGSAVYLLEFIGKIIGVIKSAAICDGGYAHLGVALK